MEITTTENGFEVMGVTLGLGVSDYYNHYKALDVSDVYIIGFSQGGQVYFGYTSDIRWGLVPHKLSAKNGASDCLRFAPVSDVRKKLIETGAVKRLCSESEFIAIKTAHNYKSMGHTFEFLIYSMYDQVYTPNSIPFWKDGDITVKDKKYNLKFFKATLSIPEKLM